MNGGPKSGLDLRGVLDRAAQVRVQNALNPLLWLSAVAPPVCFFFAWLAGFEGAVAGLPIATGILPILATVAAYGYFAVRAPDRLQSETYLLRQQELLILSKGGAAHDPATLALETNPATGDDAESRRRDDA